MAKRKTLLARALTVLLLGILFTSVLSPFSVFAAVSTPQNSLLYKEKKAAYREKLKNDAVTTDDILIGSWVSFYPTEYASFEDQLDQMAAAGINFNIFPRDFTPGGDVFDAPYWDVVEAEYAKRNMVYLMNGNFSGSTLAQGVSFAAGKEHCIGYYVGDEPTGEALPQVGATVRAYRAADPTRYPFVNLYPSYANERLGGTYRWHVETYVSLAGAENIEYLSHDFYPFEPYTTNTSIFADLEIMRDVAYKNGKLKTHAFPQSQAGSWMRMSTIDDMRWNVYAYLAYGFKALSWFNMVSPWGPHGSGFSESLILGDGTIPNQDLFTAWGELNWEVRGLSDALMNLDTVHAYHTDKAVADVEYLPENYFITPADNASFIISYMEAKDGSDPHIMLFNKSLEQSVTQSFLVDLSSGYFALEYLDPYTGEYVPADISDGVLTADFKIGEGRLYRLSTVEPDRTALIEAMNVFASLTPDHYSPESFSVAANAYLYAAELRDAYVSQYAVNAAAEDLTQRLSALNPTGIDFSKLDAATAALTAYDLTRVSEKEQENTSALLLEAAGFPRSGPVTQSAVDALTARLTAKQAELDALQEGPSTALIVGAAIAGAALIAAAGVGVTVIQKKKASKKKEN